MKRLNRVCHVGEEFGGFEVQGLKREGLALGRMTGSQEGGGGEGRVRDLSLREHSTSEEGGLRWGKVHGCL